MDWNWISEQFEKEKPVIPTLHAETGWTAEIETHETSHDLTIKRLTSTNAPR